MSVVPLSRAAVLPDPIAGICSCRIVRCREVLADGLEGLRVHEEEVGVRDLRLYARNVRIL